MLSSKRYTVVAANIGRRGNLERIGLLVLCQVREQTAGPVRFPSEQLRCAVRWFVFFSAVGSFLAGPTAAQEPIHVEVNLVNVSFTVRDSNGALVGNLTNDDFEVLEDDLPQKIAFFARSSDVPLTLGVILDASGSQEHFTKKHEEDFEVFIKDVLGPKDRAFLLCFGNHLRLVNDYTQSGAQMFEHLKEYEKNPTASRRSGRRNTATWAPHFTIRSTIP